MSNTNSHVITVNIMNRPYKIKCSPQKATSLQEAARYLNHRMKEIRAAGNALSTDRIAVVAALNMADELVAVQKQKNEFEEIANQRVQGFRARVQQVLSTNDKNGL